MTSARQREKSATWFQGSLLPAGTKTTNVIHLATALHRDALALRLNATPGWTSRIFRAIERWPDHMSLWHEWEKVYGNLLNPHAKEAARAFYDERRAELDAGAELLWPEEEDLYTLMCLRLESGSTAFEREKQCSPISPEDCEFPEAYFAEPFWFDDWPSGLELRVIALDPSKGADARHGDFSAFVQLGRTPEGYFYVEADLARRPTPQIVADGTELCRVFRPEAFGVEANQFQELLAVELAAEFNRQGLFSVQPISLDNRVNKLVRIRKLGPLLSTHRLRFKADSAGTRLLVDQLKDFPNGEHDDGPDALEMAVRLIEIMAAPPPDDGLGSSLLRP